MNIKKIAKENLGENINYLIKGGFWLSLLQGLLYSINLVVTIAFTHLASQYIYGQYRFVLSLLSTISVCSLTGMNVAIAQSTAKGYFGALKSGTYSKLRWSLLGTLILVMISIYFFLTRKEDGIWLILLMAAVAFPFLYGFEGITYYFNGIQEFKRLTISKFVLVGLPTIGILITLLITQNLWYIMGVFFFVSIITGLVVYMIVSKNVRSDKQDKDMNSYGKKLSFITGITQVSDYLDHLLVAYYLGYTKLAIFAIANIIPKQLKSIGKIIANLYLPRFSVIDLNKSRRKIRKNLIIITLLSLIVSLAGFFVLPYLIKILFTTAYEDSIRFSQILFLGAFVTIPNTVLIGFFQAQKMTKQIYKYNILASFVKISLVIILIPLFNIWGAILSILISRFINLAYGWYLFSK